MARSPTPTTQVAQAGAGDEKLVFDVSTPTALIDTSSRARNRLYEINITGAATVTVEVSVAGVYWFIVRTASSDDLFEMPPAWPRVRYTSSAMTAATVKIWRIA